MSYARMVAAEAELAREVAEWLARAQQEDAAEDAAHGSTRRGDEPPDWMRDKQVRLARIRAAKAELEAEAREAEAAGRRRHLTLTAARNHAQADPQNTSRVSQSPSRSATSPTRKVGS